MVSYKENERLISKEGERDGEIKKADMRQVVDFWVTFAEAVLGQPVTGEWLHLLKIVREKWRA